MPSLYALKPQFQALLRPAARSVAESGVSANAITVVTAALSVAIGVAVYVNASQRLAFLLLPLCFLLRMAGNALDGMIARGYAQQTRLGAYLNELGDVVSDATLYAPFALVPPFGWPWVAAAIVLSALVEMAGVLGQASGGERRHDGPLGKSDRAFVFGALGLWIGVAGTLPAWALWLMPVICVGLVVTIANRVWRGGK